MPQGRRSREDTPVRPLVPGAYVWDDVLVVPGREGTILIDPGCRRDFARGLAALRRAGLPAVRYVILTHTHFDHALNALAFPARAAVTRIMALSPVTPLPAHVAIAGEARVSIDGIDLHLVSTPGHAADLTDLCILLPGSGLLCVGDQAQPQGRSYEHADGLAPVPAFQYGEAYIHSLERLLGLTFAHVYTGHGVLLSAADGRRWLHVTLETVRRLQALAREVVHRFPQQSRDAQCEMVYDRVVAERHYPRAAAQDRKVRTLADIGFVKRGVPGSRRTLYQVFDKPGLEHFVRRFRGDPIPVPNTEAVRLERAWGVVALPARRKRV